MILSPFFHQHTQIRVASKNKCGWSQWSTVSTYKTKSKTPSPPLHPPTCSAITLNTIHLSWKEPLDNGGESIIGYSVELDSNTKKKQYEIVGNKLNTKLKALQPQTKYNIRVCSINAIGRSAWTEWMHVETKARINEIPSTPYIVDTKVLNNKSFHVSWSMDHQKSSSPGGVAGGGESRTIRTIRTVRTVDPLLLASILLCCFMSMSTVTMVECFIKCMNANQS